MTKRHSVMLAAFGVAATAALACGSSTGASLAASSGSATADLTTMQAAYASPPGKFGATNIKAAISAYAAALASTESQLGVGTSDDIDAGTNSWCPAIMTPTAGQKGTCSCPNGGSLGYDFTDYESVNQAALADGGAVASTVIETYAGCSLIGLTLTGYLAFKEVGSLADQSDFKIFFVTKATQTGAVSRSVDVSYVEATTATGDVQWFFVNVNGAAFFVTAGASWDDTSNSGTFLAKDAVGTWTCQLAGGAGTCTSDSGATFKI